MIARIIHKIESLKISFPHFLLTFGALVIIRVLVEGFAYESFILPSYADLFLLAPLFYINVLLSIMLVLLWLTKIKLSQLAGVFLAGFVLAFVNPVIHLFSTQKLIYPSLIVTTDDLFQKFFTYLFDTTKLDLTPAAKVQVILFIVFAAVYIYVKTKSWWKTLLGVLVTYAIGFFYSAPLFIVAIVGSAIQKEEWNVNLLEIIDFFNKPQGFLAIRYDDGVFSAILGSAIFICLLVAQLLITYAIVSRKKLKALMASVRPTRMFTQLFIFAMGAVYAYTRLTDHNIWSFDFGIMIVMAVMGVISSWLFSVYLNDIADKRIDKISNPNRPLPQGIMTISEAKNMALVTALLTMATGLVLGFHLFFLLLCILAIGYVYSAQPLRFKKWPFLSSLALAASGTILFVIGYLLVNANDTITNLPTNIVILAFVGLFLLSSIKDLKDYEGDKAGKVYTILTLFGMRRGKLIIALMTFAALMLFPILLKTSDLLFLSLAFGLAEIFLILDKKLREIWIFGLLFVYVILAFLIVF